MISISRSSTADYVMRGHSKPESLSTHGVVIVARQLRGIMKPYSSSFGVIKENSENDMCIYNDNNKHLKEPYINITCTCLYLRKITITSV